ncbi:mediator of RNA polymerase II transcription subunit 12 isoform X4 [Homalodisca vitripennis]|nr:mediator of RNA polymerase II transcription subunit 12 isoform X4 [Homalodisca vitripennis]
MMGFSYEKRYLKRPRLGPPDVYPQEPRQKEDELTTVNVKHGFTIVPQLPDEFGTARNCNITALKVGQYFNAILGKKDELNTLPDPGRKRQQINPKDNFWPATNRSKAAIETWFKDLAGSKPLLSLSKKAPNFNKKEEIFPLLCEYQVPLMRAAWFIKLSSAYTVAISEAKIKKRQMPDPTQEWTGTLLKFMKEQLCKPLSDYYTSSSTTIMSDDQKLALRQWQYCVNLIKHMYQEGLLERQETLQWILELLERPLRSTSSSEDGLFRLFLPLALQYMEEFVQSELLSRKISYLCSRKISQLCSGEPQSGGGVSPNSPAIHNTPTNSGNTQSSTGQQQSSNSLIATQGGTNTANTLSVMFNEYLSCPHHRDLILGLSAILQVVTLECPTALVWNCIGEGKSTSVLNGSPLDHLPCSPAALPMPQRSTNPHVRNQLKLGEELIKQRSQAAEGRWSCDKWQQSSAGVTTVKVLNALDALDRHSFERVDAGNSLDTLYAKIFPAANSTTSKDSPTTNQEETRVVYSVSQDKAVVEILCQWAVSGMRYGEHRAMAVAKLLEKRQAEVTSGAGNGESDTGDDKDSTNSVPTGLPVFQTLLMRFLDYDAPVLDENPSQANRTMFTNLVHLFAELIRHDVFSHDAYMCTLISRGDLNVANPPVGSTTPHPASNKPAATPMEDDSGLFDIKPKIEPNRTMDYDDSKIDDDLDKLLQHIKEEQQNSMDAPDSPKDDSGTLVPGGIGNVNPLETEGVGSADVKGKPSRHLLYTTHFPLPQDESSSHDCNQRHVLLYGVNKLRDEARHTVKRISKDICKLFSKKFSIDVAEGGKVKKHSRNEFNFESTTSRVQALSFFDQHVVTWQCSVTVLEMINTFASGNSNYLPVQEHVAFLFDLMELALNIDGLIDVCIQILKEVPEVEAQLAAKGSNLVRIYTPSLVLYVVGVLRRYHCCLLLSSEQTVAVFEALCRVVKHVSNPGDCCSVERCVLSHLYDLYSMCSLLKSRPHGGEPFSNAYPKIRAALYTSLQPTPSNHACTTFMTDVIMNIRRPVRIEPSWVRQLSESASNRYSFVCNAVVAVCNETDLDRLNDLGHLCAELTACCNTLSPEWLGVLMALCYSSNHTSYFMYVLSHVDIHDLSIHNSLAVFTSILIARHCFSLEDFVVHIALPSLLTLCKEGRGDADVDTEAGARLTCHLLLRLFKTIEVPQPALYSVGTSPHPVPSNSVYNIKLSCDRHLLAAAHNNIQVGPVLAVLKAILVVGDATAKRTTGSLSKKSDSQSGGVVGGVKSELSISHILGTSDMGGELLMDLAASGGVDGTAHSLSDLAQLVLREICSQEWVLERCLQNPEELCTQDMLLDSMLSPKQAQRLLHMICYPDSDAHSEINLDHKSIIVNILENLDLWTLRMSWLDMQLMYKQLASGSQELNQWLDTVAKAAIDVFQLTAVTTNTDADSDKKSKSQSMWLVAPLVSKLPSAVQGRVLKVAGQVLESGSWGGGGNQSGNTPSSRNKESSRTPQHTPPPRHPPTPSLSHHQPFLSLVLTCLKGQDDQREGLLTSLHSQLSQCLSISKDDKSRDESPKGRALMQDALLLRFSLVGGMFDTIQRNNNLTTDWAILLVQLITHGVIDLNNNAELFSTVIDMLATLIHSTLVSDSQSEKGEENRKHYQNLMRKLKKEVGDKSSPSIQHLRQLLPLPKQVCEVIACSPHGLLTDMKGNKIAFDCTDKITGLQVSEKQRVPPWDLLEGHKNPAPLSWSWFGAVRIERKPLWYEENHRLLKYHTHSLVKPSSYFLEPLPLPPEDLDPPQEKPCPCVYCNQMKAGVVAPGMISQAPDTPNSVEQSPRGAGGKRGAKAGATQRKRKQAKPTPPGHMQPNMHPVQNVYSQPGSQPMQYPSGTTNAGPAQTGMYPCQPQVPGPQWGGYTQQPPPQQQPQNPYYTQQIPPQVNVGGPRFERPVNQSKQALSNMLRMRMPTNQYQPQPQPGMPGFSANIQRQQFIRQQMHVDQPQQGPMYPQQQTTSQMYPGMQQPGMSQGYGAYSQQQPQQQHMMSQQQPQQTAMFPQQAGPNSQFGMRQEYQQQRNIRPPYLQAPNVTMNSMGGPLSQSQSTPPYPRPQQQQFQQVQMTQQQQQQRMRQMLLQQQQQQQQQSQQQQPGMVLHRQMTGSQPQNPYSHQPPPY